MPKIRSMPTQFRPLSPNTVRRYREIAKDEGVSEQARSRSGFTTAYLRAGSLADMGTDSRGTPWPAKRDAFLRRQVQQMIDTGEDYLDENGDPTRRHLALIMWAWSPDPSKL
jgi:hypothetical protein